MSAPDPQPERVQAGGGPTEGAGPRERPGPPERPEPVLFQTNPTIRPLAIRLLATFVIGVTLIAILFTNPQLLGDPETTNVALVVVQVVLVIALLSLLVKMYVVLNMEYIVTPFAVRREYELLLRRNRKQVPHHSIRSVQFDQGRIEKVLGYGTIAVNQGLGELRLPHLHDPSEMHEAILDAIEDTAAEKGP